MNKKNTIAISVSWPDQSLRAEIEISKSDLARFLLGKIDTIIPVDSILMPVFKPYHSSNTYDTDVAFKWGYDGMDFYWSDGT